MSSGDDQQKPFGRWNWGPQTAPQLRQLYHGLGTSHSYAYTSNPVSYMVTLEERIPFLHLAAGNIGSAIDRSVIDELAEIGFDVNAGRLPDTGSDFGVQHIGTPGPLLPASSGVRSQIPITGFSDAGVPLGTIAPKAKSGGQVVGGRQIALWGSRKGTEL